MSFLFPGFLYALFLLIIPIIIHLFRFRIYKKVYFPNVRFLQKIQQQSRSRNRIKRWLLLLSRMLFITALVFAFAQPYIPGERAIHHQEDGRPVSVFFDNSFSMTNEGEAGILLDQARERTIDIAESYLPSDRFMLMTNDPGTRFRRFTNQQQFMQWAESVEESPASPQLSQIVERKFDIFYENNYPSGQAFIVSDFQRSFANLENVETDTGITLNFVPVPPAQLNNVYIDSLWLESPVLQPGETNSLVARIVNSGEEARSGPVNLELNNRSQGIGNYSLDPDESATIDLSFPIQQTGWNHGTVSIDDHPVVFDDRYYFSFHVRENVHVKTINRNESNSYLNALFRTDDFFEYSNATPGEVEFEEIPDQQLIIVNEAGDLSSGLISELENYVSRGGNLLIIPSPEQDIYLDNSGPLFSALDISPFSSVHESEQQAISLNFESPVLTGVFEEIPEHITLPSTYRNYRQAMTTFADNLMELRDGSPLIQHHSKGQGNVFISSVPFVSEWTNLPEQAIFVPIMYRITLFDQTAPEIAYTLGSDRNITFSVPDAGRDEVFKVRKKDAGEDVIPEQNLQRNRLHINLGDEFNEAGIYEVLPTQAEATESNRYKFALNYDRRESDMNFVSQNELEDFASGRNVNVIDGRTPDLRSEIRQIEEGAHLWRYFIILALLFLLAEIAIYKFL